MFHNDYSQNSTSDLEIQYKKKKKREKRSKNLGRFLPQTFLGSRLPLQGDGIGNDVGDGEFPHFEGRWKYRALWRHGDRSFSESGNGSQECNSTAGCRLRYYCDNCVVVAEAGCLPAEHILGLQLHQHSVWCSAPFQRICWFFLWQLGSWKHHPLFLLHICLPFSALTKTHTHSFTITQTNEPAHILFLVNMKAD